MPLHIFFTATLFSNRHSRMALVTRVAVLPHDFLLASSSKNNAFNITQYFEAFLLNFDWLLIDFDPKLDKQAIEHREKAPQQHNLQKTKSISYFP